MPYSEKDSRRLTGLRMDLAREEERLAEMLRAGRKRDLFGRGRLEIEENVARLKRQIGIAEKY